MNTLKTVWEQLTAQVASPGDSEAGGHSQLLASLLLLLFLLGFLLQAGISGYASATGETVFSAGTLSAVLLLAGLFLLSRTRYYRQATLLATVSLSLFLFLSALNDLESPFVLIYLVAPVLLSSIFLSLFTTLLLASGNLLGLLLLLLLYRGSSATPDIFVALHFYTVASVVTILGAYHRQVVERERRLRLSESEVRFRTLAEEALVGVYIIQDGLVRYANPALAAIFGYEPQEIMHHLGALDLTHPDDRARVAQNIQQRLAGQTEIAHYTLRGLRKDGEFIECEVLGRRTHYGGRPAIMGTLLDITKRRRAEEVLREREALYRSLFENAPIGLAIVDETGSLLAFNDAALEPGNFTRQEILNLSHLEQLFYKPEAGRQLAELVSAQGKVDQHPIQLLRKDGTCYDTLVSVSPISLRGRACWQLMIEDVTERKLMEEAERAQRALAEALSDTAKTLNSTLDLNKVLERILDNVGRVVPHQGVNIMLIDGDSARVVRCQGYYVEHGFAADVMGIQFPISATVNFQQMARDGEPFVVPDTHQFPGWINLTETAWVRSYVGAPISREGKVIGFLNLDSAIPHFFNEAHAQRLQAFADQVAIALQNAQVYQELENYSEDLERAVAVRTRELQRTMEQLAGTLNSSPDAILLLRFDGRIEAANPAFSELFGYGEKEILQLSPRRLVTERSADTFMAALHRVTHDGQKRRLELTGRRRDGGTFDADVALAPVKDGDDVRGAVCSLRDISRMKELDRMKDAFVSNVSHELRTPITSLRLYHDLLSRNPHGYEVYLGRLEREIDRLNVIVEDLLRLSRLDRGQVTLSLEPLNFNVMVAQHVNDRIPLAREKAIDLRFEQRPATPVAVGDGGLIEQVISILLTNALNYTPVGGEIVVTVETESKEEREWVGCRVRDTGPGISAEEQEHLFERFFRGEAAERSGTPGTGLGLAIAKEIIESHGGRIEVNSQGSAGDGTAFTMWIPVAPAD